MAVQVLLSLLSKASRVPGRRVRAHRLTFYVRDLHLNNNSNARSRKDRRPSPPQRRLLSSSLAPKSAKQQEDDLPSKKQQLIEFSVAAKIEGDESQIATVQLRPGETLRAESGAMLFMTQGVEMATSLQGASSAFQRMMTGQNVFLTDFSYAGSDGTAGTVGLGTDFPSKIVRLSLEDHGGSLIAQRGAYLASNPSVEIAMEFTKSLSQGFFGGQGFILQRLSGAGDVLVKAGGTLVEKELEEGEVLRVTSGSIVAFEPTVAYDIQMMPGIKNVMFGGEGLFVTTLTGPGKIWLQGMPPDRMIAEIASRVPSGMGFGPVIPLGGSSGGGDAAGGAGEAAGNAGADGAAGSAAGTGEEMVAATDEAVNSDRQATVASSGMSEEGSGKDWATSSTDDVNSYSETTFSDDGTTFSTGSEPTFSDDTSFSTSDNDSFNQQSDFFEGDSSDTEIFDTSTATEEASEAAGSTASSILSTLWDFFTGDD